MLSPRLTNCPECANIPSLLRKIDCKLAELGNNLYNNISYMLNKPIPAGEILQLITYRRILTHKYCNLDYVHEYSVAMIASRVIRITVGCVSRCNTPEPCIEVPCDITIVPNPTTSTTSSTTSTSSTSSTSTTSTSTTLEPTTTTTTTVVNYIYRMAHLSCITCEPLGDYLRRNSGPLTVGKFYYDDYTGFVFEILEFIGTTTLPSEFNINIETIQDDCVSVICSPSTTTTTTTVEPTTTTTSSTSSSTTSTTTTAVPTTTTTTTATPTPTTTTTSSSSSSTTSTTTVAPTTTTTTTCLPIIFTTTNYSGNTYRDGTTIPEVTNAIAWAALTTGAWCYYNFDPANGPIYGKLYNWYAVAGIYDAASLANPLLRKQFAPIGFHVPSDQEFTCYTNSLGGDTIAGGAMKETGTTHWTSPNTGATNSSGFTALPGGGCNISGAFQNKNNYGFFWTSTEYPLDTTKAWIRYIAYNASNIYRDFNYGKNSGFSVHLVQD
jgi:uncharacterized protein (TIGR02145 family)